MTMKSSAHRRRSRSLRAKVELVGAENFHQFERNVMLQSLDTHWREHLAALDHLRQGITCAATRRRTPSRNTSASLRYCSSVCSKRFATGSHRLLVTVQIRSPEDVEETAPHADVQNVQYHHADYDERWAAGWDDLRSGQQPAPAAVQRSACNDPCPAVPGKEIQALPRKN